MKNIMPFLGYVVRSILFDLESELFCFYVKNLSPLLTANVVYAFILHITFYHSIICFYNSQVINSFLITNLKNNKKRI